MIKILLLLSLFILNACDYKPLYSSNNIQLLNIEVKNYEGNVPSNTFLISKLKIHKNKNLVATHLDINTEYLKLDLSKNTSGEIVSYKLILKTTFFIKQKNYEQEFTIEKETKMEKFTDKFNERDYEKKLIKNMTNSIYEEFILKLSTIIK